MPERATRRARAEARRGPGGQRLRGGGGLVPTWTATTRPSPASWDRFPRLWGELDEGDAWGTTAVTAEAPEAAGLELEADEPVVLELSEPAGGAPAYLALDVEAAEDGTLRLTFAGEDAEKARTLSLDVSAGATATSCVCRATTSGGRATSPPLASAAARTRPSTSSPSERATDAALGVPGMYTPSPGMYTIQPARSSRLSL